MNRSFWKGKKVFLTGHTGFKGSWAALWLTDMGAEVFGYSLPAPTEPSLYEAVQLKNKVKEKIADICDFQTLLASVSEFKPEIVIHMAAQPLVRYSYDNPIETYATNVMGTVNILEAIRKVGGVRSAVMITTDKCYENVEREDLGYKEHEPMGGYDPYSSSKGCAELVVSAMRRSFFSQSQTFVASARAGNVIGGGDWAQDRLIPDFVKHFSKNEAVFVRNPLATRPWQHVMEPLCGYFSLAEKLYLEGREFAEAWNFGPFENEARNVEYIANKLTELWGENAQWKLDQNAHPHEAKYLKLNIEKAMNKLNWKPRLNIDETLSLTTDWYKKFYSQKSSVLELTLQQIKAYEARIK